MTYRLSCPDTLKSAVPLSPLSVQGPSCGSQVSLGIISELRGSSASPRMSHHHHGCFPGTPGFLAPEIVAKREFGLRADVYSLGCVLVCVLTWARGCKDPAQWLDRLETGSLQISNVLHQHACVRAPPSAPKSRWFVCVSTLSCRRTCTVKQVL